MSQTKTILTLSGSLRKESFNTQLALLGKRYLEKHDVQVKHINLNEYLLPLFNEEIEHESHPQLDELRQLFSNADGLLIASPEYNGSFSAALKNTIDWLSRPGPNGYQSPFSELTVALVAASPGGLGGIRGLSQLRELMGNLGSLIVPTQLAVGGAHEAFNEDGDFQNPVMSDRFGKVISDLARLC